MFIRKFWTWLFLIAIIIHSLGVWIKIIKIRPIMIQLLSIRRCWGCVIRFWGGLCRMIIKIRHCWRIIWKGSFWDMQSLFRRFMFRICWNRYLRIIRIFWNKWRLLIRLLSLYVRRLIVMWEKIQHWRRAILKLWRCWQNLMGKLLKIIRIK